MLSLAERIQANRPSTAAPAGRHWWSWFTAMPLKSAFAAALIATVIVTTMQVSPPQDQTDLVFAQWAWEEVLDETPDSQPGVLSDEFGFLITDS